MACKLLKFIKGLCKCKCSCTTLCDFEIRSPPSQTDLNSVMEPRQLPPPTPRVSPRVIHRELPQTPKVYVTLT